MLARTQVVEEQMRDAKQLIFKKRRRKNSRRLTAHRQVSGARRDAPAASARWALTGPVRVNAVNSVN